MSVERSTRVRRRLSIAMPLVLSALWIPVPMSRAQGVIDDPTTSIAIEQRVKAASLFRFLGYVEWPTAATGTTDPYRVGVLGADDIAAELSTIAAGRLVNSRAVVVRRVQPGDELTDLDTVYIGGSDTAKIAPIIRRLRALPILIVTSARDALAVGSMINFRIVDERVRFEVALEAVEHANLHISSRMLTVALQVTGSQSR
jgi:hypothetical protein